jgi:hypothetical protein
MFFGALMDQNIPFGANDDTTLRCLDRWGRVDPARGGTDDDGGTPEIICNSLDDDCDGLSTNYGGGVKTPIRSKRSADTEESSSSNYIIIIAVIAAAYLIFKKK